ncbi:hypothetical protein [Fluviispira vulneris]|uniref:hypothetical protein n=1 Tax=Fluviispira vulneris TaxID=2763012 RepID=UPI0016446FC5|nr:hypothetical protein [Fluviispira vulneris]
MRSFIIAILKFMMIFSILKNAESMPLNTNKNYFSTQFSSFKNVTDNFYDKITIKGGHGGRSGHSSRSSSSGRAGKKIYSYTEGAFNLNGVGDFSETEFSFIDFLVIIFSFVALIYLIDTIYITWEIFSSIYRILVYFPNIYLIDLFLKKKKETLNYFFMLNNSFIKTLSTSSFS